jgi:hypothetical protein
LPNKNLNSNYKMNVPADSRDLVPMARLIGRKPEDGAGA